MAIGSQSEDDGDGEAVNNSVRPFDEHRNRIEEAEVIDEVWGDRCYVCGVGGEVEEVEGEEDGVERRDAEDVERFAAVKDERVVMDLVDPRRPTAKEVEEHERFHLPYRNWCPICVQAKGRDADHRKCTN